MKQHLHSHKPAVGIPAQVDSVPVNLLMPVDKIRDQPLQRLYIHGRSVLSVLPGAVVHPHGRRLRRQQISAAEHLLYPGRDQIHYLVARSCDQRLLPAFSRTVQPDQQRHFMIVRLFWPVEAV